jgi:hypothetical protein
MGQQAHLWLPHVETQVPAPPPPVAPPNPTAPPEPITPPVPTTPPERATPPTPVTPPERATPPTPATPPEAMVPLPPLPTSPPLPICPFPPSPPLPDGPPLADDEHWASTHNHASPKTSEAGRESTFSGEMNMGRSLRCDSESRETVFDDRRSTEDGPMATGKYQMDLWPSWQLRTLPRHGGQTDRPLDHRASAPPRALSC